MALIQTEVSRLYISIFGRASEEEGNLYWQADGTNITDTAHKMLSTDAARNYFGTSLNSDHAFIEHIYLNTFGKTYAQDTSGVDYWVGQLAAGKSRGEVVAALVEAAQLIVNTGAAQDMFNNKVTLSNYYADLVKINDMTLTSMIIKNVDSTAVSLERAKKDLLNFSEIFLDDYALQVLTSNADTLNDTNDNNWIYALAGNDVIYAGDGTNMVYGGDGDDRIYGYAQLDIFHGQAGNDTLYGGEETDTLYGEDGNDSLHGDAGNDYLWGDAGNDYLYGDAGNDTLYGGEDDDHINAGLGDDIIYGESGNDWIDSGNGINWVDGGSGDDTMFGGSGIDQLFGGEDNDIIYGLDSNDILDGMNGNDTLYGGNGDDIINGNAGVDIIYGNAGVDYIRGELGIDILYGGAGADILYGGEANDIFVFELGDSTTTGLDLIGDFTFATNGADTIRLPNFGTEAINSSAISVTGAITLSAALTLITSTVDSDGSNALISWFIFEDNTYIYDDMTIGAYNANTDIIIKIQGIINLVGIDSDSFAFN